jgi:hypothetical protein
MVVHLRALPGGDIRKNDCSRQAAETNSKQAEFTGDVGLYKSFPISRKGQRAVPCQNIQCR